jgi:beta-lactam-binding protein with PASTA domain
VLDLYAESDDAKMKLLQDIGYRPTFYALPDTTGEVRVTLRLGQGAAGASTARAIKKTSVPSVRANLGRQGLNTSRKLYASPVDAGYTNQYGFNADVSAKLTFRIVPIPPPDGVDELRLVPNVVQDAEGNTRSLANARSVLAQLGLAAVLSADDANVDESRLVASQDPAAASIARAGDTIVLTLAE